MDKPSQQRIVVTVVGQDTVGIIARTCTLLAERNVNILDLSQGIVQGFFNMILIADMSGSTVEFAQLQEELAALGVEIGLEIRCQREEIFEMMHRV